MRTLGSGRGRCVHELSMIFFSPELLDCISRIRYSPSDVVIWAARNWSARKAWWIKSESPGKQAWRFQMGSLLFVLELMQRECWDLINASKGPRLISMLELIWSFPKVYTLRKSFKWLLRSSGVIVPLCFCWLIWLSSARLLILIWKPLKAMGTTVLFILFLRSGLLWRLLMDSLRIWRLMELRKTMLRKCKQERNFMSCWDMSQAKNGISLKMIDFTNILNNLVLSIRWFWSQLFEKNVFIGNINW